MYQIFVVEDELLIRQRIRDIVENMGGAYSFCGEASDGEMALSMMQDLMPDIMLTDIKMPFLDGFGLIQHAKFMMPWLKVIIISGYDEFESAQKAIALGVDCYLLKPVRPENLTDAIHKLAKQLEQERRVEELPTGYQKDEVQHALYQHFMQQLLFGETQTAQLLNRAKSLDIDIVHPFYQVVLFHFEATDCWEKSWKQVVSTMMTDRHSAMYYFSGTDQLVLLVYAKSRDAINETSYRFINILRHELCDDEVLITTVVGNIAERISGIKTAYDAASATLKRAQAVSAGQIIDSNDTAQIVTDIVSFNSSFGETYGPRLMTASPEDVPNLLAEFWGEAGEGNFNSMLYRYYALVDILKTAVDVIDTAKPELARKDIAARISSAYDVFTASAGRESSEQLAKTLLQEAVRMRQENLGIIKHSHVISKAEEYIAKEYCNPDITLISVAKHVGMSPAHFSTIFSQTMGITFINYLTGLRIERAKQLLAQSDQKLSAIALEIGYNEPNYFSHVFKKVEGITPKEYRSKFMKK